MYWLKWFGDTWLCNTCIFQNKNIAWWQQTLCLSHSVIAAPNGSKWLGYISMFESKVHDWASLAIQVCLSLMSMIGLAWSYPRWAWKSPNMIMLWDVTRFHELWLDIMCSYLSLYMSWCSTAMFEFNVLDGASLVITQMGLKKPKHAQICPVESKPKTAADMFSGHKLMSLCAPT